MIEHYHHTGSVNADWLRAIRELESDFPPSPSFRTRIAGTAQEGPMAPAGEAVHPSPAGGPSPEAL